MMEHHPSNLTLFDELGSDVSSDVYDHQHLARCLRVVFTVLAIMIGITGIVFNIGFVFSTIVDAQSRAELTLQTKQLIVSLAIADILLLIFGYFISPLVFFYDKLIDTILKAVDIS